jgi:hypothetical protein
MNIFFQSTYEPCSRNCPSDQPKNWRSQNISLMALEVVIIFFQTNEHEVDFLKVLFRGSPKYERMQGNLQSFQGKSFF